MRRRDRLQNRFKALYTPSAPGSASPKSASSPPPQQATLSQANLHSNPPSTTQTRIEIVEKAIAKHTQKIPEAEKLAFKNAFDTIDEQALLSSVRAYDVAHKNDSSFRAHSERVSKFLGLLDRFMGGLAIGIQANPEVSALVVGAARIVIDLAIKFTTFFSRLTDMICTFEDYLKPLAEYSKAAGTSLVEDTVVNAYANVLDFGWKARRVFIDANGNQRKWTCLRAFMRQHWETFEMEFASIKDDMQHHLNILLHSVQALHFNNFTKTEQARQREEKQKEKSAFLAWMSSIDFEKVHQDIYAKKHANTCDWLINEPNFQQWFLNPASSLLWCYGKPGIGKSVLASNILEYLTAKHGLEDDTAICFAYYNYREAQLGDLSQIVAALLKQLCRRKVDIPSNMLQIKLDALSPSLLGTKERFLSLIEDLSQVFVVFDALDECPENGRNHILHFITSIVTATSPCRIKVFVTSRREMDIAKAFEDNHIPTIQLMAENVAPDIWTFTHSTVQRLRKGQHGKTLYVKSDGLAEIITRTLVSKADGMFLWVSLQLDSLCRVSKAQRDHVVEAALQTLPEGLPATYVRILERIENQSLYMKELALNCLAWIIYAQRPLKFSELQHALLGNQNCRSEDEIQLDTSSVILEACGNLLEEGDDAIQPVHFTVQEFLAAPAPGPVRGAMRAKLLEPKAMQAHMSLGCLGYIRLMGFDRPEHYPWDLEKRLKKWKFAQYACQSFDHHIFQCGENSVDVIQPLNIVLQQNSEYLAAILQVRLLQGGSDVNSLFHHFHPIEFPVSASTIIYSTRLYDIPSIRERWINDEPPTYALHLASAAGLVSAVIRLLDSGCDIHESYGGISTPLNYACSGGHVNVVQVLLERGANANGKGDEYDGPLQMASYEGFKRIVELLLNAGADINNPRQFGGTALQTASAVGQEGMVKLLLEKGANIDAQSGNADTALLRALLHGHERIARLLLEHGANPDLVSTTNGDALQVASGNGLEASVKLLVDKGVDVNAQHGHYGTALQAASAHGRRNIVELLLDHKAHINIQNGKYGGALHAASFNGHRHIVELLLNRGADVNARGLKNGRSALEQASGEHNERISKILLAKGADLENLNEWWRSYANMLAYYGHARMLRFVHEEYQAALEVPDSHGRTAILLAAGCGHVDAVQYLMQSGVDPMIKDLNGNSLLDYAALGGSRQILDMILDKAIATSFQIGHWTTLHWACRAGSAEVIERLIQAGLRSEGIRPPVLEDETLPKPDGRWSPLSIAVYHGKGEMIEDLSTSTRSALSTGADSVQPGVFQDTYACNGCFRIIYGKRYFCATCVHHDYCFMCAGFMDKLHKDHDQRANFAAEMANDSSDDSDGS